MLCRADRGSEVRVQLGAPPSVPKCLVKEALHVFVSSFTDPFIVNLFKPFESQAFTLILESDQGNSYSFNGRNLTLMCFSYRSHWASDLGCGASGGNTQGLMLFPHWLICYMVFPTRLRTLQVFPLTLGQPVPACVPLESCCVFTGV